MPRPRPACTLPPGHAHGSWRHYHYGCRCDDTCESMGERRRARFRQIAYGREQPNIYVDAAPAREHIDALRDTRLSYAKIAKRSGVSRDTIQKVHEGKVLKSRRLTVQAILDTPIPEAPQHVADITDATGTRRRLQALARIGWGIPALAQMTGVSKGRLNDIRQDAIPRTRKSTAVAVAKAYDALWNTPPAPSPSVTYIIRRAERLGWAPPLAWDEGVMDDPDATPAPEWDRSATPPIGGLLQNLLDLLDDGFPLDDNTCQRAGYKSRDTAARALLRAGRSVMEWSSEHDTAA